MNSQKFEGRSAEMKKDSPWLAAEDIEGLGDVVVEIEHVYKHTDVEFEAGRKEKAIYSMAFKNGRKQLILNSTNRVMCKDHFGSDVKNWIGKKITLYIQEGVKLKGKLVKGIRIRIG
jgi:hypothetical protein